MRSLHAFGKIALTTVAAAAIAACGGSSYDAAKGPAFKLEMLR